MIESATGGALLGSARVVPARTLPSGEGATWNRICATALAAQMALIARREQMVVLNRVTAEAVELPERSLMYVTARGAPAGGWGRRDFFVVDADTKDARDPIRHRIELKYPPKAARLVLEVTPSVRRALGTATHVHVAYADDFELEMMRSLHAQLSTNATRGPLVEELWSGGAASPAPRAEHGLNTEQSQALKAMTTRGGWLVWGPPGTGKTKVIVKAVASALASGRSVLIASHTHVAVDNVVKDLAAVVTAPGQVIRVGSDQRVDEEVVAHDWLMIDKAAAALTRREERLAGLIGRQQANRDHADRGRLESVLHLLGEAGISAVEQAIDAVAARRELAELERRVVIADQHMGMCEESHREVRDAAQERRLFAGQRPALQERESATRVVEIESERLLSRSQMQLREVNVLLAAAVAARHRAEESAQSWRAKLPWTRVKAAEALARAASRAAEMHQAAALVEQTLPSLTEAARRARDAVKHARRAVDEAGRAMGSAAVLSARQQELAKSLHVAEGETRRLRVAVGVAQERFQRVSDPEAVVAQARAGGVLALRDERERLIESVSELDEAHKQLARAREELTDEYRDTLRSLLERAPVIACTLSALTTKPELASRRFDLVIIDEAASASVPQLIYAGSKADVGLAYVGDYLQNAPIADPGDAITDEQLALLPWQQGDIFGLLGIQDRASAMAHPRCVALRTQYRYPSTIADIVNDFCYDGLLESHRQAKPEDGIIVTFIDTSGHPRRGLRRDGGSWVHDLGLEILTSVSQEQVAGVTIGMVCPYRAHADAAGRTVRARGLPVECGTSHSFQGRQFETVIVDLMQDEQQPRWIAAADIRGNQRAQSAAKLLNVAITRAQHRLYLIGDWPFITRADTPGMRALAALRTSPHFEIVPAALRDGS
jgi:hypothetical protein